MNFLINVAKSIKKSKIFLFVREGVSRRLERILPPSRYDLQQQFELLLRLDGKLNNQAAQLLLLEKKANTQIELLNQVDGRNVVEIKILHKLTNMIDEVIYKEDHVAYFYCYFTLIERFGEFLKKIIDPEQKSILQYDPIIFIELLRSYMYPGGIWELKKELMLFDQPHSVVTASPSTLIGDQEQETQKTTDEKKLKILFVCGMFPCVDHGGGLRLVDIIFALGKVHEVDIYSVFDETLDSFTYELLKGSFGDIKLTNQAGMNIDDLGCWLQSIGKSDRYYDVVQCEYSHTIKLIDPVKLFGRKVGFTFMECLSKSFAIKLSNLINNQEFEKMPHFANIFWRALVDERKALAGADFCIAVTPEDREMLQRLHDRNIDIVPTCLSDYAILDEVAKHATISPVGNSVIFLGYYDHFPNIEGMDWYLRKIHPIIRRKVPDYKIYVVGKGDVSSLKETSQDDESVVYTGRVDNVVPEILKSKVCILPLISGAGIRGKLNQYSIAGRPSVSTSIGNKGLGYVDTESILIADAPEAFAEAVVSLLGDDNLSCKIGQAAQAWARKNFTWERHLENLLNIYSS